MSYINRVQAWAELGYGFAYIKAARAVGFPMIGFLLPFNVLYMKARKARVLAHQLAYPGPKIPSLPFERILSTSPLMRFFDGYLLTLNQFNQNYIMRPVANMAALLGGAMGLVAGLVLSVVPYTPPHQAVVTKDNKYFADINIGEKSLFAALVWGGIVGAAVGAAYPAAAPILILGRSFQGALGFAQLFSAVAGTLHELPNLVENTWHAMKYSAQKIAQALNFMGTFIKESLVWGLKQISWIASKIVSVLSVIKAQGLRGLFAFIKDKTVGAALRYVASLNQVSTCEAEIRALVTTLVNNPDKKYELFSVFSDLDQEKSNLDIVNIITRKISTNAELQREDINKGSIGAKIAYLQNIKINLERLSKPTEVSDSAALHILADLLNAGSGYHSDFAPASTFDAAAAPLRFRSANTDEHLLLREEKECRPMPRNLG